VFVAISSVVHSSLADLGGLPLQGCLTFGLSLFRLLARMDCLACWFLAVPAPLESANSGSASCLFLGVVASLALTLQRHKQLPAPRGSKSPATAISLKTQLMSWTLSQHSDTSTPL
jgi:hypothetical protein